MVSIINAFLFFQGIYFQLPRRENECEIKLNPKLNLTLSLALPKLVDNILEGPHTGVSWTCFD